MSRKSLPLALVASLVFALAGRAADAPSRSLTLTDALALTEQHHPLLKSRGHALDAAAARVDQAARSPAFALSVEMDNFAGSGALAGTDGLETTLRLARALELGGKRDARFALARTEASLVELREDATRLDLLAETARRFLAAVVAQERLVAAREAQSLAAGVSDAVGVRATAGAASIAERGRAEIAARRAALAVEDAEQGLLTAQVSLAAMWDARELNGAAAADLYALPDLAAFELITTRLDRNPTLLRFATDLRRADAERRLAETSRSPDVELNAGVRRFETTGDQGLVFGLSVPLGSGSRAASVQREVDAERSRLPLAEAGARAELYATLHALHQEARYARTEADAISGALLPRAREVVDFVEAGYRAGRFTLLDWSEAQRQWLELRIEGIQAAARCHTLLIEIERLTGGMPAAAPTKGSTP